jgi:diacylglycerol O-acyltransferase
VGRFTERIALSKSALPQTLAPLDQAAAVATRATGRNSLIQITWIYDHGVDRARVDAFHAALANGLLGRRVVRSPLPFGPPRWVRCAEPTALGIAKNVPRARVDDWFEERRFTPIDPFTGPGWHLGMAELDDGAVALTLVSSHVLADGVGTAVAAAEASFGMSRDLQYQPAAASALRTAVADAAYTVRGLPRTVRGLRTVAALPRPSAGPDRPAAAGAPLVGPERSVMPYLDRTATKARAAELGGKESTLLFVMTARIASALGWVRPSDGVAVLGMSVARRTDGDLRANAIVDVQLELDPATEDLPAVRAAIKQALTEVPETERRFEATCPLAPLLPRRLVIDIAEGQPDPNRPITTCAGVGVLPVPVRSPVGEPADRSSFRLRWSDLPGGTPVPRAPFLYVGWTGTEEETSVGITTNLATASERELSTVVTEVLATLGLAPLDFSVGR